MRTITSSLVYFFLAFSLQVACQSDVYQSDKLAQKWELTGLDVPESVLPVPGSDILYVSNVGSKNSSDTGGSGFISVITKDGKIRDLKWSTGLNSPKGMAIYGDKLYVSEVNRIAAIDLKSGKKLKEYPVENALFLNDIAVDDKGVLYITDSRTGTVYKLENDQVSIFVQSKDFNNPNGVVFRKGILYLGTGHNIIKIDPITREIKEFMPSTGGVDGLAVPEDNLVLFSDWPGKVYVMKSNREKELLLDTKNSETFKTADFGYIPQEELIFIPTFFRNSVICYKLSL